MVDNLVVRDRVRRGGESELGFRYGLVTIFTFLAQSFVIDG
jgi:hypothetical protein